MVMTPSLKFSTTDKEALESGVNILVYGDPGVGKTCLCATCEAPIILSAEAGLLSLRNVSIPVIKIETIKDMEAAYEWLSKSNEAKNYRTVCLDSITELSEVVLSNAREHLKDGRAAYGEVLTQTINVIRHFRDLRTHHTYLVAGKEYVKDETGIARYQPIMPGQKLPVRMPYHLDEVFHLGIEKGKDGKPYRSLRTQPDMKYVCKDRSGVLMPQEPPHLGAIINKIFSSVRG